MLGRLEDSPSGLWRTLGKRVGCKPSGVRIPHPPPVDQHKRRAASCQVRPASSCSLTSSLICPRSAAHSLRDITPDDARHVLVSRRRRGRRPPHDPHHRALRNAEDQQHRRHRVAGIVEASVPQSGIREQSLPVVVVRVRIDRLADWRGEDIAAVPPGFPAAARSRTCSSRWWMSNAPSSAGKRTARRPARDFVSSVPGRARTRSGHVGGVAVRARRTHRGAAVAARGKHGPGALEQHRAVAVQDPGGAGQVDGAAQPPVAWTCCRQAG